MPRSWPVSLGVCLAAFDAYVICTAPRSGSTLLCHLLQGTGRAGVPESYFHSADAQDWYADHGLIPSEYPNEAAIRTAHLEQVRKQGSGETGIFGLRLQRHSFDGLMQHLTGLYPRLPGDRQRFEAAFGRVLFISLRREDHLDQAISYVRARQSGLWHKAPDGREIERLSPPKDPVYDATAIAAQLAQNQSWDRGWQDWFQREEITPLRITYSQLAADPKAQLNRVLSALGRTAVAEITIPTARLAGADNRIWAKRFRAEQRQGF